MVDASPFNFQQIEFDQNFFIQDATKWIIFILKNSSFDEQVESSASFLCNICFG